MIVDCVVPARNRAWILPKWFASLLKQTHPIRRITVLDNSCPEEDTTEQTEYLQAAARSINASRCEEVIRIVPYPSSAGEPWERGRYTQANFADITNAAFQEFLKGDADFLFYFDTDQECGKDAVEKLLALNEFASGLVIRTSTGPRVYNFLGKAESGPLTYDRRSLALRTDVWVEGHQDKLQSEPFPVGFVSGAVLLHRRVVESARCDSLHKSWEWGAVWDQYWKMFGYGPLVEPRVWTAHHMKQGEATLEHKP